MIRDGVMAAIAGTPNAGKSSLLNCLLQSDRAIVTDVPGTTRDVLEEWISLKGVPVCLVDTAGIRETEDRVEQIGVTKARSYMDKADITVVVIDRSRPLSEEDKGILASTTDKNASSSSINSIYRLSSAKATSGTITIRSCPFRPVPARALRR